MFVNFWWIASVLFIFPTLASRKRISILHSQLLRPLLVRPVRSAFFTRASNYKTRFSAAFHFSAKRTNESNLPCLALAQCSHTVRTQTKENSCALDSLFSSRRELENSPSLCYWYARICANVSFLPVAIFPHSFSIVLFTFFRLVLKLLC